MTRFARGLAVLAGVWCVVAGAYLLYSPVRYEEVSAGTAGGADVVSHGSLTFTAYAGAWGVALLVIAAGLGLVGAWAAWRGRARLQWTSAMLLLLGSLLGSMSIGMAYLPAALLMLVSAALLSVDRVRVPDLVARAPPADDWGVLSQPGTARPPPPDPSCSVSCSLQPPASHQR